MRGPRRSLLGALLFVGLLALVRGEFAVTNACGAWASDPVWDNPRTLDLRDVNALAAIAVPFTNPLDEARRALAVALPGPARALPPDWSETLRNGSFRAHPSRAPPGT